MEDYKVGPFLFSKRVARAKTSDHKKSQNRKAYTRRPCSPSFPRSDPPPPGRPLDGRTPSSPGRPRGDPSLSPLETPPGETLSPHGRPPPLPPPPPGETPPPPKPGRHPSSPGETPLSPPKKDWCGRGGGGGGGEGLKGRGGLRSTPPPEAPSPSTFNKAPPVKGYGPYLH